ncbi:hypothetical protein [Gulosibacter hominis]|uniref:hypothetical protein n=1 Tax=Gulosibacter hominis TaxID=2770504 RepID=UPI0019185509|nr:hypothetical protein [Gulosibacter hominis]
MQLLRRELDGLAQLAAADGAPLGGAAERLGVELPGALLEWPVTAEPGALPVITVRDAAEADWFWQLFGEAAHLALLDGETSLEVTPDYATLTAVQRLGRALWARAWWPTSEREGIAPLDDAVLAAEIVTLSIDLDELAGDALDSEREIALAAHSRDEFAQLLNDDEESVRTLGERLFAALEWEFPAAAPAMRRRADYALAASAEAETAANVLASGAAALEWQRVPAGIFDASESAIHWSVDARPDPVLHVLVDLLPGADPTGIPVAAQLGTNLTGEVLGTLDARGGADLPLHLSAAEIWVQDWAELRIRVGAAGKGDEDAALRQRVRDHARSRLVQDDELTLTAERQAAAEDF